MEQTKANTEKQMAEAILWIVKEYGDDFTNEDPEGCALIMESFIAGQDSCQPNIGELEKTVSIQDAAIEVPSDSVLNLEAQNKELREALESIARIGVTCGRIYDAFNEAREIAEQALKEDTENG